MGLLSRNRTFLGLVLALAAMLVVADCAGANGADGAPGAKGATGATGAQGAQGPSGAQGAEGAAGPAGEAGADGVSAPVGFRDTNRNGPPMIVIVPTEITVGDTGVQVFGAGWAPRVGMEIEFHRLTYAKSQVVRARPLETSTHKFLKGRANDSGAFVLESTEPFTDLVEVYLDELGVDEAIFTVIARSTEGEEASFPVKVKRSAS